MMSIQIRKATLDDLPAIHAVHVASIGSHQCRRKYSNDYLERKIMSLNQDQYKLPILNCEVLVASVYSPSHSGESIAGFGRITTLGTVGHEIQWLFVHPHFFKTGIGTKLLHELEKEAQQSKGSSLIKVSSSVEFYLNKGYIIEQTFSDCVIMVKNVLSSLF